jgi:hypothetical protein
MADESNPAQPPVPQVLVPTPGHPSEDVFTIYCDGVTSFSPGPQTVRFYLSRLDPNFTINHPVKVAVIAQIIMPLAGFLSTAKFFQAAVNNLGMTQEQIDEMIVGPAPK